MKKLLLFFITGILVSCHHDDNPFDTPPACYGSSDFYLRTQAEVEAFAALGYCGVQNLVIGGGEGQNDIVSLEALSGLYFSRGNIAIQNCPLLTSLEGLNNVTNTTNLYINNNNALTDISALSSLIDLRRELYITDNSELTSLDGLQGITRAAEIGIYNCNKLKNMSGLNNLTKVDGTLAIDNCANLESLEGLNNLNSVHGIRLFLNPALASLQQLENLKTISNIDDSSGYISISGSALTTLAGLEGITDAEGSLNFEDNLALRDFCAITNLIRYNGVAFHSQGNYYNPYVSDFTNGNCSIP